MNANELRIGNLAIQNGNGVRKIYSIESFPVGKINNDEESFYSPIPLTEEWFIKMGFEKHDTNPYWFRFGQICVSVLGVVEVISWDMKKVKLDIEINFVHDLQNLIKSLTGKELEFKISNS